MYFYSGKENLKIVLTLKMLRNYRNKLFLELTVFFDKDKVKLELESVDEDFWMKFTEHLVYCFIYCEK